MPEGTWSAKRERQYEHIKEGLEQRGDSEELAEEIAARTVNKERARHGESKTKSRSSTNDISSEPSGRPAFPSGCRRPDARPTVRRGQTQRNRRSLQNDQGAAQAGGRSLIGVPSATG